MLPYPTFRSPGFSHTHLDFCCTGSSTVHSRWDQCNLTLSNLTVIRPRAGESVATTTPLRHPLRKIDMFLAAPLFLGFRAITKRLPHEPQGVQRGEQFGPHPHSDQWGPPPYSAMRVKRVNPFRWVASSCLVLAGKGFFFFFSLLPAGEGHRGVERFASSQF